MNIYFRQVIPSIMEVPARLCCIFLLEQMGRKWSLIATLFQGTMMCLLILIIPSGTAHPPGRTLQPSSFLDPLPRASCPVQPTRHLGVSLLQPWPTYPAEAPAPPEQEHCPPQGEAPRQGACSSQGRGRGRCAVKRNCPCVREWPAFFHLLPIHVRSDG